MVQSRLGDEESAVWQCWGECIPAGGDSWCKGPEAATNWACSRKAEYGQCGWNRGKEMEKGSQRDFREFGFDPKSGRSQ